MYKPKTTFAGKNPFVFTPIKSMGRTCRFSVEQVRIIRAKREAGVPIKVLVIEYASDRTTISNIVNYKHSYKDIE